MNAKKSKKLRKKVYGDLSLKIRNYTRNKDGSVVSTGLRSMYQAAKKRG